MAIASVNISLVGGGNAMPGSYIVYADPTQTNADITAALAVAGGAHNSTPELNTIQTDVNAMTSVAGDVHVVWNTATCTTKNQMRNALRVALAMIDAGSSLTG